MNDTQVDRASVPGENLNERGVNEMKRIIFLVVSFIVMSALLLTGCGSTQPAAKGLLADLQSGSKTLRVGSDATFPPFEFTDSKGTIQGFDIDLVKAIAQKAGIKKVDFKQITFDGLIPGLQENQFDMVASAMYITDARKKVVDFSDTYFPGGLTMMVKPDDNSIKELKDLDGRKVSVQVGTKSVDWLKANAPKAQLMLVKTNAEMFQSVVNGQADACVTGLPAARYYVSKQGNLKVTGPELTKENYGYAFRKTDKNLLDAWNKGLAAVKQDGTYKQIENKWFGGQKG